MEIEETILSRRSIREYSEKEVSEKDLKKIIISGVYAPSACDIQGWKFIIIHNQKIKERIVELGGASFIKNAPLGILILYDNRTDNYEYMDFIQSASASIQNMLLTAHSLGIGSCWVCHLPRKKELRELFNIPKIYEPIAYITLGYAKNQPPKEIPKKYSINEIISYNKFNFEILSKKNLNFRKFARKIFYLLPVFIRKKLNPIVNKKFERKF